VARAQQAAVPVIGFIDGGSDDARGYATAFRNGLGEAGYVGGQNGTVEYHWLEGQFDRLPVGPSSSGRDRHACHHGRFDRGQSCNRYDPGRFVLPCSSIRSIVRTLESTLREVQKAAGIMGLHVDVLNASTNREIDAVF
jgi:hypothetical protein